MKKTQSVEKKVNELLLKNPNLKDNDKALVFCFWSSQIPKKYVTVLASILSVVTSQDMITRARRKLQNENPKLRGKKYNLRQVHAKKVSKYYSKSK